MRKIFLFFLLIFHAFIISSCYQMRMSRGGGQTSSGARLIQPADIALPEGYEIRSVTKALSFPSAVTFDEEGNM